MEHNYPTVRLSYSDSDAAKRIQVRSSQDAISIINDLFKDCMQLHEEIYIMLFSRSSKYLGSYCIGRGASYGTVINIQGALQAAILSNCAACMITHNHPSGQLTPSGEDDSVTEKLQLSLRLFKITLLDHIIATADGYYSYADEGRL